MSNNMKWNTDAEMCMMGFPVAVESEEHLKHMVGYILWTLKSDLYADAPESLKSRTEEVVDNAMNKYNSSKDKSIKYIVVNDSMFGVMITFVRDKKSLTLKSGKMRNEGILAWVENIDAPDCSELGYVFFETKNGKTVRIG